MNSIIELVKKDRKPIEIIPGLYLGSIASIIFSKEAREMGITHVITATKGLKRVSVSI